MSAETVGASRVSVGNLGWFKVCFSSAVWFMSWYTDSIGLEGGFADFFCDKQPALVMAAGRDMTIIKLRMDSQPARFPTFDLRKISIQPIPLLTT